LRNHTAHENLRLICKKTKILKPQSERHAEHDEHQRNNDTSLRYRVENNSQAV